MSQTLADSSANMSAMMQAVAQFAYVLDTDHRIKPLGILGAAAQHGKVGMSGCTYLFMDAFGAFVPGLVIGVLGLVSPTLATLASFPVPLILIPVLFASFFANARDVFGLPEGKAARVLTPPDTDATPD